MTRILLGVALALALALVWAVWDRARLQTANARLTRSVAALEASREQARLAYEVADAHRKREAERAERFERALETVLTGDFADADLRLDPRITELLECLRAGNADACDSGAEGAP